MMILVAMTTGALAGARATEMFVTETVKASIINSYLFLALFKRSGALSVRMIHGAEQAFGSLTTVSIGSGHELADSG